MKFFSSILELKITVRPLKILTDVGHLSIRDIDGTVSPTYFIPFPFVFFVTNLTVPKRALAAQAGLLIAGRIAGGIFPARHLVAHDLFPFRCSSFLTSSIHSSEKPSGPPPSSSVRIVPPSSSPHPDVLCFTGL